MTVFLQYPQASEAGLTTERTRIISNHYLTKVAKFLQIEKFMRTVNFNPKWKLNGVCVAKV
jgi:dsRNA-specific ribonuclease